MKKFPPRRFFILLALLLGIGLAVKATFFPARGYQVKVLKVPPAYRKLYWNSGIDTRVVVNFSPGLFRDRQLLRLSVHAIAYRSVNFTFGKVTFEDVSGNLLTPKFSRYHKFIAVKTGPNTYSVAYEFPRSQLPNNGRKMILKTEISNGAGWKLPIEVPL